MRRLIILLVIALTTHGCDRGATHGVGKTVELTASENITEQAVTALVRSVTFKQSFIGGLPGEGSSLKTADVSFKVWTGTDDHILIEYTMPGSPDSKLDEIGEGLRKLIEEKLAAAEGEQG